MALYIVIQTPKKKYENYFKSVVAIVEADSAKDAVIDSGITRQDEFHKPKAELLILSEPYFI